MTPESFRQVADHFAEPAVLVTREGTVAAVNRAVATLGWSPQALVGRALADLTSSTPDRLAEYLRLCSRSREPVPGAFDLVAADGQRVPCRCHGAVAVPASEAGGPLLFLRLTPSESSPSRFALLNQKVDALTEEIRRRKRAEERLRDQTEWLQVTLASIGDAIVTTDAEGRVTFLNPVGESLTGWRLAEARGRPLEDVFQIVHEQTREPVVNPARRVLAEGTTAGLAHHTLLLRRGGGETPVNDSAAPIRDASGAVAGVVLVFRDSTQRRQAEAALRESEQRFRGLMEQSPFSVQIFSPDGRTLRVNRAWEELWGVTLDQIGDYNILGDPQLAAKGILPYLERAFAGEGVVIPAIEYDPDVTLPDRSQYADSRRWVSAVAYPLKDTLGQVREVVLIHDDITARMRAEQALVASEQKFRLMADNVHQLVWMALPDGHIFWYNQRWYEYTGTTPKEMEGWGWQRVHDPRVLPAVMERWRASLDGGVPFDMVFPLRGADGVFRPFLTRVNPLRDDAGNIVYWFGTNTDISEQKLAEDAAQFLADVSATLATVTDYRSTLEKIAWLAVPRFGDWCAVDMVEPDGSLRGLAITHVDPAKVQLALELQRRYPPDPDAPFGAAHVARTGEPELVEHLSEELLASATQDDEQLRIARELGLGSYLSVPMKAGGKVLGVLTFVAAESGRRYGPTDLALAEGLAGRAAVAIENARLYAELLDTDRRKDEFLATLAHELRNPLAPIRNSLQILKMPSASGPVAEHAREMMERQLQHLVRLVDDLLDVSRVMRGKIELRHERLDLGTVVAHAVETAQPVIDAQGHELVVTLPQRALEVDGDSVRLTQVIANLLANAAKYTPRAGQIWLTVEEAGDHAVVRVRDNGIGIAPEMLSRVFDLFVQADSSVDRSRGGLGIGLTLVRSLVEMHAGSVEAHSAGAGRGSEFVVSLPRAASGTAAAGSPTAAGTGAAVETPPRRVLVVDDNVDAAESLAMLLSLGGNEVEIAHDGRTALRLAHERRPDLVLLDLGMPGMDGYEVARRLRQDATLAGVLLVALTGWGQEEDRRRSAAAGFDLHVVKPVEPATLKDLLGHPRLSGADDPAAATG